MMMKQKRFGRHSWRLPAASLGAPAAAQDIPAGWSVDTKPKRAILTYAPEANGPRYLIVACLRDSEEIGIYSTGIARRAGKPVVALRHDQCGAASTRCAARWAWTTSPTSRRSATRPISTAGRCAIFRAEFIPMLSGKGPLTVTIGDKSQQVPLAGVASR